ncbi:MAG: 1-acyl-sn-glycerol-3-phosphate acyltransferase [Bacteroidales bacterium]|nr:1-acyl-sn-glycerol-3-phosphate acyltransferase [Bacteroidales bacterium]
MNQQHEEIGQNYIDLKSILAAKGVRVPGFVLRAMERLLHVEELNNGIYLNRNLFGLDFVYAFIEGKEPHNLGMTIATVGAENIPSEGNPMIVGNHPLGGPDGVALMGAVGRVRKDIRFPVNDFLLYLPGLRELFVPIDKVNRTRALASLEQAFASSGALLYYPAGACSRKQKGVIKDLEWKSTFVKKAVRYERDIVPVFTDARNRNRFYNAANIRKHIGIKFPLEMAMLPSEMYAQRGGKMTLVFGRPIPWQTFDSRHTASQWAALLKEHVYKLKDNPDATFEA